jgi:hypothetical protein
MTGMAGMAEWQKEWQMAELQITITTYKNQNGGRNGGMAERMAEWSNGGNGYLRTIYGTRRQRHFNLL